MSFGPCMCGGCAKCGYVEGPDDCPVCHADNYDEQKNDWLDEYGTCGNPKCYAEMVERERDYIEPPEPTDWE